MPAMTRVEAGPAGCLVDLGFGGVEAAVGDVLADGAGEEEDVLLDDADLAAEGGEGHVADIDAVDRDAAAVELVEARQEGGDRRLAGAGGADEGDGLAGADVEVDVRQDRLVGAVAEGDVLVADVAAQVRRPRSRRGRRRCRARCRAVRCSA